MDIRIGCSGYHYRHWRGLWYPETLPSSRWFAFYAAHFDTVEINASFYRFPSDAAVARWRRQAPAGFTYSIKAPRLITHSKRLAGCDTLLGDFYTAIAGLGEHLGCVLFQLPPNLHYTTGNLETILAAMRQDVRNVVEFRHAGWWRDEVVAALRQQHVSFCSVAAPNLPDALVVTGADAYLRLHGNPWYVQDYGEVELARWAARLRGLDAERLWVYFNNDAEAHAPYNAECLRRLLSA